MASKSPVEIARNSLYSSYTPEMTAVRTANLSSVKNPLYRYGALAVHKAVLNNPQRAARLLGVKYGLGDAEITGQGYQSVVLRSGNDVLKVCLSSMEMTADQRSDMVDRMTRDNTLLRQSVPDYTLPQKVFTGPHPAYSSIDTVQISQPFIPNFTDTDLFGKGLEVANVYERVAELEEQHPGTASQLASFVTQSRTLYDDHQLYPDTAGIKNLVLTAETAQLILLDGQPIDHTAPVYHAIGGQLDLIETALS